MTRLGRVPRGFYTVGTANPVFSRQAWPRRSASAVAGLATLTTLLLATANFTADQANDCIAAFLPAWKLAWHETAQIPEFVGKNIWVKEGPWGALSNRLPGTILWAVPFYRVLGISTAPTFFPAAVAAATAVSLGVAAIYAALLRLVPRPLALSAVTLLALGTGIWTTAADALWTHGPNVLWLGLAMWALSRDRWLLAGLALGLGITTRPHLAFAAAAIGVVLAMGTQRWRPLLTIAATSSLGLVGLLVWNHVVWDQWALLTDNYAGQAAHAVSTAARTASGTSLLLLDRLAGTLVSPGRGLLIYSPFLLLLLPGLLSAWRAAPPWVRACLFSGLAYMAVQLLGNGYSGGDGFTSYRLAIEMVVLASPMLTLCWSEWTSQRTWRRFGFALLAWIAVTQHAIGAFVGHDDHVIRDHWRSYPLAARFPEATTIQWAALALVAAAAALLLSRVARQPRRSVSIGSLPPCPVSKSPPARPL